MEIVFVLLLFLLNGVFSMAEIAIVSSKRTRLEQMAKKGDKGAATALAVSEDPTRFLSTVQVGITLIGILTGLYTGSVFSLDVQQKLEAYGLSSHWAVPMSVIIVVLATTYFSLILGELVPKKIGLLYPERIASRLAPAMQTLSKMSAPAVSLLTISTNALVQIFRIKANSEDQVTEEDVKSLIAQGTSLGTFDEIERNLVERVFHFSDRRVGSLMVSRAQIDWIDLKDSYEDNVGVVRSTTHSHLLVCLGELDAVEGVLSIKKLSEHVLTHGTLPVFAEVLDRPIYLPDSMGVLKAVEKLKDKKNHLAVVVNEFGGVQGILTLKDIFESLIYDLGPEESDDALIVERADGSYLIDGSLSFAEFVAHFDLDTDLLDSAGFHTMAGLFLAIFKQFPSAGDHIVWSKMRLEVVDMDGKRIDKLLVAQLNTDQEG